MGVKAEHRLIEMSRRHFDEQTEAARRDPWNIVRNQDAVVKERDAIIQELKDKVTSLERDLARAKRCIRTIELSRTIERQNHREEQEQSHTRYISVVKAMFQFRRSWEKLSKIVRIGMTPEQYHNARLELPMEEL